MTEWPKAPYWPKPVEENEKCRVCGRPLQWLDDDGICNDCYFDQKMEDKDDAEPA